MNTRRTLPVAVAVLVAVALCGAKAPARELPRFGPPVLAEYPTAADGFLKLSAETPPRDLTEGAEIVVVTGYEPTEAERRGVETRVVIDRPGKKVVLVLASYETVHWRVTATPGVRLAGILASGHQQPFVSVEAADADVPGYLTKIPYVYKAENLPAMRSALARAHGIEEIDVFRASYAIPPESVITAPDPPKPAPPPPEAPRIREPESDFTFKLLTRDFREETWTLAGPGEAAAAEARCRNDKMQVLSPDLTRFYSLRDAALHIRDLKTGAERTVAMPARFPDVSWPCDLAYDSRRDLAALTTLGGEGFLYRFDARAEKWLDFHSLRNLDTAQLAYDATADRYVAVAGDSLAFLSPEGERLFTRKIGDKLQSGDYRARLSTLLIAPHGDDIALVSCGGRGVDAVWHYNVKTDRVALTYYRPEKD